MSLIWEITAVGFEVMMPIVITWVIYYFLKKGPKFSLGSRIIIILIPTMMGSMLNALSMFLGLSGFVPFITNVFITIIFAMTVMGFVVSYLVFETFGNPKADNQKGMRHMLVGLMIWNEASLGIFAYIAFYGMSSVFALPNVMYGFGWYVYVTSFGVNSFLFIAPMATEMIIVLFLTKERGTSLLVLLSIFAMAVSSPTLLGNYAFIRPGTLITTAVMVVFMTIIYERLAGRSNVPNMKHIWQFTLLFVMYLAAGFAVFFGSIYAKPFAIAWLFYAVAMLTGMYIYFDMVLGRWDPPAKKYVLKKKPGYLAFFLTASLVSEWFMAAALMVQNAGNLLSPIAHITLNGGMADFAAFSNALHGTTTFAFPASVVDVAYIFGSVTNSLLFWSIMGAEMSSLVIIRAKRMAWKEKQVNLYLAVGVFWAWTVFFQSSAYEHLFGAGSYYLPFWPNVGGITGLQTGFLYAVIGSYAIFIVLAVLFGRRSYCSTLCPSAVMYGGTLGQRMIEFNYTSSVSRKNIGSRYKSWVLTVGYNSWFFAILLALFSVYTQNHIFNLSLYGVDAAVFYSLFVWNFLWYLFFVTIPFVGMSPCRRYGWCSTGTLMGFFGKLGFFKLQAKNPSTCATCPTKDCVTNCEVGLGDLPKQFISQGFFKSSKCVGAGSCISACPYDNIELFDVRHYIKGRRKQSGKKPTGVKQ